MNGDYEPSFSRVSKEQQALSLVEDIMEDERFKKEGYHTVTNTNTIWDFANKHPEFKNRITFSVHALKTAIKNGAKNEECRIHSTGSGTGHGYYLESNDEAHTASAPENKSKKFIASYDLHNIINDGCFIEIERLQEFISRLEDKKNIIFQGPPGTGKTWLAKRLAYAFMKERAKERLQVVQFHPNLSYEDFIRGWRPDGAGGLALIDGPLMNMINKAKDSPEKSFVLIIEEVNRGNPAQIFGEMLTLLEADKRDPNESMTLCYSYTDEEPVYIPENLFVIGTMNIADRSLSIVDFALRRRFAFIDLYPELEDPWKKWLEKNYNFSLETLNQIQQKLKNLNSELADDSSLGKQFQIGHSYVTPPQGLEIEDGKSWFKQVVKTEILPLLEEYWFDSPDKVEDQEKKLLADF